MGINCSTQLYTSFFGHGVWWIPVGTTGTLGGLATQTHGVPRGHCLTSHFKVSGPECMELCQLTLQEKAQPKASRRRIEIQSLAAKRVNDQSNKFTAECSANGA